MKKILILLFVAIIFLSVLIVDDAMAGGGSGGGGSSSRGVSNTDNAGISTGYGSYNNPASVSNPCCGGTFSNGSSFNPSTGNFERGRSSGGGNGNGGRYYSPPPPPPPTPPTFNGSGTSSSGRPTSGSSVTIIEGNTSTLTWSCADSSSSSGVNFSSGGAVSGSAVVTPANTTTYTIICSNGGQGTVTVTVLHPVLSMSVLPTLIQSGDTVTVEWNASNVNSCTISEDSLGITDSWTGISGLEISSAITEQTVYALMCQTDAGSVSQSVTVKLVPVFQEF